MENSSSIIKHNYQNLCDVFERTSALDEITMLMNWDSSVMSPPKAAKRRGQQLAVLEEMRNNMLQSQDVMNALENVAQSEAFQLTPYELHNFELMKRQIDEQLAVSNDLQRKMTMQTTITEAKWLEARASNDFNIVKDELAKSFALMREKAIQRAEYFKIDNLYDAVLQEHNYGFTSEQIDADFASIKQPLLDLCDQLEREKRLDLGTFDKAKQLELCKSVASKIGFDFDKGRLDISSHPFCTGRNDDNRVTTRIYEDDIIPGIMATIHEVGHSHYNKNLPHTDPGQPITNYSSMSIHESQALFWENHIGNSDEFAAKLIPLIKQFFGADISVQNFIQNVKHVEKTTIRVNADQVTYPLHVMLRHKLEKDLFNGDLNILDIRDAWNDEFKSIFGFTPKDDNNGCLQDIHWYWAAYGYFPSYFYGIVIAAQLRAQFEKEQGDLLEYIANDRFTEIEQWLKTNIHDRGKEMDTKQLVRSVCGEGINPQYLVAHLHNFYGK